MHGQYPQPTCRVMVADSNVLVGLGVRDELERNGYTVAGPFPSCAAATEWLNENTADAAILAIRLSDGTCAELARELRSRNIPFVVYSGDHPSDAIPEVKDAVWIAKPAQPEVLSSAVAALLARPELRHG